MEDISTISKLTKIDSLAASDNKISNIEALSGLNLVSISMSNNQISDISPLKDQTNLGALNLNNNQVEDISSLSKLTNIYELFFSNNQISDISAISDMNSLRYINLSGNHISDITYNFSNGETLDGDKIILGNNFGTPIEFSDHKFTGTINFTRVYDKPTISLNENVHLIVGQKFDIMDGVTAVDAMGENLTSDISIENVNDFKGDGTDPIGNYTINYSVSDSLDQSVTVTRNIVVDLGETPVITQPGDITLNVGDKLDLLENVVATDTEDGNLTNRIVVSNPSNFKGDGTDVAGEYKITYIVTDSNGNVSSVTRTITVVGETTAGSSNSKEIVVTGTKNHIQLIIGAILSIITALFTKYVYYRK